MEKHYSNALTPLSKIIFSSDYFFQSFCNIWVSVTPSDNSLTISPHNLTLLHSTLLHSYPVPLKYYWMYETSNMQCNNSFIQIINFHGLFRNALRCRKTGACRILVPLQYPPNEVRQGTMKRAPYVCDCVCVSVRASVCLSGLKMLKFASSLSFLGRFWFCLFYLIGLGGGFKTSTQNFEIH